MVGAIEVTDPVGAVVDAAADSAGVAEAAEEVTAAEAAEWSSS